MHNKPCRTPLVLAHAQFTGAASIFGTVILDLGIEFCIYKGVLVFYAYRGARHMYINKLLRK